MPQWNELPGSFRRRVFMADMQIRAEPMRLQGNALVRAWLSGGGFGAVDSSQNRGLPGAEN